MGATHPHADSGRGLRLTVGGVVQGVGFRPFVHRIADELQLHGWVRNCASGVEIEAYGARASLALLRERMLAEVREPARIENLAEEWLDSSASPRSVSIGFHIAASTAGPGHASVAPDLALCSDCLNELFAPGNRRHRYAFTHCTRCGPRYSIIKGLPYDRAATSMAGFALCGACRREYEDASNRRFHAEANACPACGPQLAFQTIGTQPAQSGQPGQGDPVTQALAMLADGGIVAVKGYGGFHLACDARNETAVARLRQRKHRDARPFAVMFANTRSIAGLAAMNTLEQSTLESAQRPIVLLRKSSGCDQELPGVAPGLAWLGAMLPYSPLHYLLFHQAAGHPAGCDWLAQPQQLALVMTSANLSGEPLLCENGLALDALAGMADGCLLHDRDIVARCDDSVVRIDPGVARHPAKAAHRVHFLRRARGFVPAAIALARSGPAIIALGGWMNNTVALTRDAQAYLSPHIGDLGNAATCEALMKTLGHLQDLLGGQPQAFAHDMHPDFFCSRLAARLAGEQGVPAVPVQHHHAHIAAVMAEHCIDEPVLGLALDGTGYGTDGTAWGGELLRVDGAQCQRLGHLRPLAMPGGDRAAVEPWRMAAAALHALDRAGEIEKRFAGQRGSRVVAAMLRKQLNSPATTSMGRWFDAAAAMLGVCETMQFEAQAAMRLETLALEHGPAQPLPATHHIDSDSGSNIATGTVLDLLPLLDGLAGETDHARGAARFHASLVAALTDWVLQASGKSGLRRVVFGGGCFMNGILCSGLRHALESAGLQVLEAVQVPPGDGGLSLGQAWVAQHILAQPA